MCSGLSWPSTRTAAGVEADFLLGFAERTLFDRLVRLDRPARQRHLAGVLREVDVALGQQQPRVVAHRVEQQQSGPVAAILGCDARLPSPPRSGREQLLRVGSRQSPFQRAGQPGLGVLDSQTSPRGTTGQAPVYLLDRRQRPRASSTEKRQLGSRSAGDTEVRAIEFRALGVEVEAPGSQFEPAAQEVRVRSSS